MSEIGDYDISKLDPSALMKLKQRNGHARPGDSYEVRNEREQQLMKVREPRKASSVPGGKPAKVDGRSLRKTGRTAQVNLKTTPEAKAMLSDTAARLKLSLAATFELAIRRLEAEASQE